jgi:hypothetical protein
VHLPARYTNTSIKDRTNLYNSPSSLFILPDRTSCRAKEKYKDFVQGVERKQIDRKRGKGEEREGKLKKGRGGRRAGEKGQEKITKGTVRATVERAVRTLQHGRNEYFTMKDIFRISTRYEDYI